MLEFKYVTTEDKIDIFHIYDDEQYIGAIELTNMPKQKQVYIDNINLCGSKRGKGYLRKIVYKVIEEYSTPNGYIPSIVCLPLPCHLLKYIHIGFTYFKEVLGDKYYILVK